MQHERVEAALAALNRGRGGRRRGPGSRGGLGVAGRALRRRELAVERATEAESTRGQRGGRGGVRVRGGRRRAMATTTEEMADGSAFIMFDINTN